MLVLTTVIMLLLLVKDADLSAATDRAEMAEGRVQLLEKHTRASSSDLEEKENQIDLAREVKKVLVRGGAAQGHEDRPRLAPKDVEAVRRILQENTRLEGVNHAVDGVLERAGAEARDANAGAPADRIREIEQLGKAAAIGNALRRNLTGEAKRSLDDAMNASRKEIGEAIGDLVATLVEDADVGRSSSERAGLGDQVGFDPCWPRVAPRGARRYFYTYDVTYADDRYDIQPNKDWNDGISIIDTALEGDLSILKRYPRGFISADEFQRFGERIESALRPLRGTFGNNGYPEKCLLAVTLNEDASGSIAKFLRHKVGLYPITR